MTKDQRKILKFLYGNPRTMLEVKNHFHFSDDQVRNIFNDNAFYGFYEFQHASDFDSTVLHINNSGISYVDDIKTDNFRFWIPIVLDSVLSVAAIVISIISLLLR